jgi:hypothetical protein
MGHVKTNSRALVAPPVGELLVARVTGHAKALQLAQDEGVPHSIVRLEMVGDIAWCDAALFETHGTKWLAGELELRQLAPTLELIPIAPASVVCLGELRHSLLRDQMLWR